MASAIWRSCSMRTTFTCKVTQRFMAWGTSSVTTRLTACPMNNAYKICACCTRWRGLEMELWEKLFPILVAGPLVMWPLSIRPVWECTELEVRSKVGQRGQKRRSNLKTWVSVHRSHYPPWQRPLPHMPRTRTTSSRKKKLVACHSSAKHYRLMKISVNAALVASWWRTRNSLKVGRFIVVMTPPRREECFLWARSTNHIGISQNLSTGYWMKDNTNLCLNF